MRWRSGACLLWLLVVWGCEAQAPPAEPNQLVVLLHTSDLHSHLWPFRSRVSRQEAELGLGHAGELSEVGGLARLATLLAQERQAGPALWLDSGDALEGTEVFQRFGGRLELELLSRLGLDAFALGNHELSLSGQALAATLGSAAFPVLAANVRPRAGSALEGLVRPSVTLTSDGVAIGVVGIANPTSPPDLALADNAWGLELLPLLSAVQAAVDDVRPRAHLVVVLSHLGLDADRELVGQTTGIDLVLGGHQHLLTPEPEWVLDCAGGEVARRYGCTPQRVAIVHSGAYGQWLSRLELSLRPNLGRPTGVAIDGVALRQRPASAEVASDAAVGRELERLQLPPEFPLGFLPDGLSRRAALGGDSPLGNFVTDALLAALETDVVVLNTSGLRGDLEAGPLLRSDLALAFPFDEPWRRVWIAGRDLRRGLERAARRAHERDCVSTFQLAGLDVVQHCDACAAAERDCLAVERHTPFGTLTLDDDQLVLLALPEYLTRAGADFEQASGTGELLDISLAELLARRIAGLPAVSSEELRACVSGMQALPDFRCKAALGVAACPAAEATAQVACRNIPAVRGGRDDRIQMLP